MKVNTPASCGGSVYSEHFCKLGAGQPGSFTPLSEVLQKSNNCLLFS